MEIMTPERMRTGIPLAETIIGFAAVVLAIIGLTHIAPWVLAAISTIALGTAFLFESGAVGARYSVLESKAEESRSFRTWLGRSTMMAGFLAGCAGIALGFLSLLNIHPEALIPIAAVVYGVSLVVDSGIRERIGNIESERVAEPGIGGELNRQGVATQSGIQIVVGLGGVTLGILALTGIYPATMSLVALLSIGTVVLLSGSLLAGRMTGYRS